MDRLELGQRSLDAARRVPAARPGGRPSGRPTIPAGPAASARIRTHRRAADAGSTSRAISSNARVKQGVPRQDGRGLVKRLVTGRPAPPQVVVVHRRQVIVDQRIRVNQLQSTGRAHRRLRDRRRTPRRPSGRAPAAAACHPPARCNASPRPAAPAWPLPARLDLRQEPVQCLVHLTPRLVQVFAQRNIDQMIWEQLVMGQFVTSRQHTKAEAPRAGLGTPLRASIPSRTRCIGYC